jgi:hypothetical protein
MDPEPKVPTFLYIGRRGRITERVIGSRDWVPSLLHDMCTKLILAIVHICPSWFALISMLVDRVSPRGLPP